MNSYLAIAEMILKGARMPLTPREIVKRAYKAGIVPDALYGQTQHKTMQARLSEDILRNRERSRFFRTAPGRFFLRTFLSDITIPAKHRTPIVARRRQRDLPVRRAMVLDASSMCFAALHETGVALSFESLREMDCLKYIEASNKRTSDDIVIWSYLVVTRNGLVLTYRHGPYREGRDEFLQKRSIGFYNPVSEHDLSLFDQNTLGVVNSGLTSLCLDLDLDPETVWQVLSTRSAVDQLIIVDSQGGTKDLLAVVNFDCPDWLEPLTRRLSINGLRWHDLHQQINHIEDFDPWSQAVLAHLSLNKESGNRL